MGESCLKNVLTIFTDIWIVHVYLNVFSIFLFFGGGQLVDTRFNHLTLLCHTHER